MDYDAGAAVLAGLIGGAIMVVPLYMGMAAMPNQMRPASTAAPAS